MPAFVDSRVRNVRHCGPSHWPNATLLLIILVTGSWSAGVFNVRDAPYNAAGNGLTNDRLAIQKAIDDAGAAGGGTVLLPGPCRYLSGNLTLKSNVTLCIDQGAVLVQSQDTLAYSYPAKRGHDGSWDVAPWPHLFHIGNYPLIYATNCRNVKIAGAGLIRMTSVNARCDQTIHAAPIGFFQVDTFEISDVSMSAYGAYALCLYGSAHGLVKNVNLIDFQDGASQKATPRNGNNCDGISIQNSQHIRVTECMFSTGDDAGYVWASYRDPRGVLWWNSNTPHSSTDIEIDHCVFDCNQTAHAFAVIIWGGNAPDQATVTIGDLRIHDNLLVGAGAMNSAFGWWGNGTFGIPSPSPVIDIRLTNNVYNGSIDGKIPGIKSFVSTGNTTPQRMPDWPAEGALSPNSISLFGSKTPDTYPSDAQLELGTRFKPVVDGIVTRIKIFANGTEQGMHTVRIWRVADSMCIAGPFAWWLGAAGQSSWRAFPLPAPAILRSNTEYIVSVTNSHRDFLYGSTTSFTPQPGSKIAYLAGCRSTELDRMPRNESGAAYFRDIEFVQQDVASATPAASRKSAPSSSLNRIFSTRGLLLTRGGTSTAGFGGMYDLRGASVSSPTATTARHPLR